MITSKEKAIELAQNLANEHQENFEVWVFPGNGISYYEVIRAHYTPVNATQFVTTVYPK